MGVLSLERFQKHMNAVFLQQLIFSSYFHTSVYRSLNHYYILVMSLLSYIYIFILIILSSILYVLFFCFHFYFRNKMKYIQRNQRQRISLILSFSRIVIFFLFFLLFQFRFQVQARQRKVKKSKDYVLGGFRVRVGMGIQDTWVINQKNAAYSFSSLEPEKEI